MTSTALTVSYWILLLAGIVPAGWFLLRYRPTKWADPPAVIMRGLVLVGFLAYLRPLISLLTVGGAPTFRGGWFQICWSYTLLLATDFILIKILRVFLRYRRAYAEEMSHQEGP